MKRSLRILCLAMALLLCGGLLAACSDGSTESGAESSADNTSGTTSESLAGEFTDEKGNYIASLSGNTYGGQTITFLVCTVNETYNSELVYNDYANPGPTTSNEQIAEVVNKAYKDRNELVEEQLGITIAEEFVHDPDRKNSKMVQRITQDNLVFMATYQVVVPCLYDGANLAKNGALLNLYDLPDIQ
ncbi:MAG: hypothetical protein IIX91_04910, partial [Clostridia bacterium]|nr:hypothetical protein [Clostridia bacterium]